MTVPAEFPATSLICMSILPNRYSFLDWKPEPEVLSRERVRRLPPSSIFARLSPQVMSKSWWKLPTETAAREVRMNNESSNETWSEEEVVVDIVVTLRALERRRSVACERDEVVMKLVQVWSLYIGATGAISRWVELAKPGCYQLN